MNLQVPGATIYYEVAGSGPLLLMIPGAPNDAGGYAALAGHLADRYTVVRYDVRGTSRSAVEPDESDVLAVRTHVDDARRLLTELGEPAYVLGCSGGAMIALDLLAQHPDQVLGVFVHEPPMMSLLPDAAKWQAAFEEVYQTYVREGAGAAMGRFIGVAMGTDPDVPAGPPVMPDLSQLPPEALESMARLQANSDVFLGRMLRTSFTHQPDFDALRAAAKPITIAVGESSKGQMPHEVGVTVAERLGIVACVVPGDHTGFSTHPAEFAEAVHEVFYG